ncbi:hypothetical protein HKD37_16G045071 [Glycine soja]
MTDWMNESRISPEYEEGVEQFLQFASQRGQPDEDGKYYCPCINCLNGRRQILDDIREHLLCDGIKRNYTTWIWHGEMTDMQSGQQSEPFDVEMGDHLEDMIRDLGQESFQQAHAPVYERLQGDSKKPLYPGQKGITECGYYVMHWMSTIILGSFRNNWETYFNEVRPLEAERFKALRIQWAQYYLKVRNQT